MIITKFYIFHSSLLGQKLLGRNLASRAKAASSRDRTSLVQRSRWATAGRWVAEILTGNRQPWRLAWKTTLNQVVNFVNFVNFENYQVENYKLKDLGMCFLQFNKLRIPICLKLSKNV